MSAEYQQLAGLNVPPKSEPGDMWVCRRLGIVIVANGVERRRGRKHSGFNAVTLYHWGEPSFHHNRSDWDAFAVDSTTDSWRRNGETWRYAGNIFDRLPYAELAGVEWRGANRDY